ncbi:hypothetical protein [Nitratidesulfovibrio sp. SRB-5]|uniref:hypothetical protein n=1 Tax=Nitratidesulfovibrio sp. SRB-5 TaxID=2872636 RepID=UPI0010286E63|nr:hypothetical protein [Nitratidesulfovibrio sp. SRB-5]MBZ2172412.1 hypothetical protein [Nitratidesulfovibrio sp. SRB-5]RXF75720.1 hypothetical protein EKK70_15470 [Desulfovibrio sp. DS-1]
MSTERTAGGTPAATVDDAPDLGCGRPGQSDLSGQSGQSGDVCQSGDVGQAGAGATAKCCLMELHQNELRQNEHRREDRRQADRRREDRQLRAALPLAVEAARGVEHRALPDRPDQRGLSDWADRSDRADGTAAARDDSGPGNPGRSGGGGGVGSAGTARARCCACGSRDVWLLHDGVVHLVGCRRCGRTGPGALSAPLAVEVWNSAEESRFCRGLPPDAEMMAPCMCEAPPPDAGTAVSYPAHLRPLGSQVMPAPVLVHRLSPYGAQLSGHCETLCPWLEGAEGALCELALPMADGRGWTLFALRVESARREGDELFAGGAFVRQGERQRGLLDRMLDAAAVNEKGQGDEALAAAQ